MYKYPSINYRGIEKEVVSERVCDMNWIINYNSGFEKWLFIYQFEAQLLHQTVSFDGKKTIVEPKKKFLAPTNIAQFFTKKK